MAVRPCLPWPDKRLRTPAAEIEQITDAHRDIWQDLIDTMEAMPGVGMGANQIGEMVRLALWMHQRNVGKWLEWPTPSYCIPQSNYARMKRPVQICQACQP